MSLEKFDTRDVNGVRQNKGLRLRGFATFLLGVSFFIQREMNTTLEPVSPYKPMKNYTAKKSELESSKFKDLRETLNQSL